MELDHHQVADFSRHWVDTYVLHQGRLVYVEQERAAGTVTIKDLVAQKSKSVLMTDLEMFNPVTGYYNSLTEQKAFFLTRLPRQQQNRGFSFRNSVVYLPTEVSGKVEFHDQRYMNEALCLHEPKYYCSKEVLEGLVYKPKPFDISEVIKKANDPFGSPSTSYLRVDKTPLITTPSIALSRSLCAVQSKMGYVTLMYHKIPIGYYFEGKVYLDKSRSLYQEQLNELNIGEVVCS